jgi:hypothetical protein
MHQVRSRSWATCVPEASRLLSNSRLCWWLWYVLGVTRICRPSDEQSDSAAPQLLLLVCVGEPLQVHTTYEDGVHAVLFSSVPDLDVKPEWVERARARTQSVSHNLLPRGLSAQNQCEKCPHRTNTNNTVSLSIWHWGHHAFLKQSFMKDVQGLLSLTVAAGTPCCAAERPWQR